MAEKTEDFGGVKFVVTDCLPPGRALLLAPGDHGPLWLRPFGLVDAVSVVFGPAGGDGTAGPSSNE